MPAARDGTRRELAHRAIQSAQMKGGIGPLLFILGVLGGVAMILLLGVVAGVPIARGAPASGPGVRTHYIAAEDVVWDYAPGGLNQIRPSAGLGEWGEVTKYQKVRYVEYTDATFANVKTQPSHLGILGPVIHATVGDTIRVHFYNRGSRPYSIHPHGVFYDKDNEGAPYAGIAGRGHIVESGGRYTYTWGVPGRAGPGPDDASSVLWLYHSHVNPVADVNAGLMGVIVVTGRGRAREDGRPADVDRELFTLFQIFDENKEGEEDEGNLMHAINGFVFGNLPGLDMNEGERVRWYLIALGNEVDLHTPHWHGTTVLHHGHRKDVIELLPATTTSADMIADNAGTWLFHCHVTDHITAGMLSLYRINRR